jgi:alkaline phosphatase D
VRTAAEFVVEAGHPGIAAVSQETPAPTKQQTGVPVYAIHDDQDSSPLRG